MYVCAGARVAHARPVSAYIYIFISVNYLFLLLFCLYRKRTVCFCSGCPVRFQSSQIGGGCMPDDGAGRGRSCVGPVPGGAGPVSVLCRAVPVLSVLCRSVPVLSVLCRSVPVLSVLSVSCYSTKKRPSAMPGQFQKMLASIEC